MDKFQMINLKHLEKYLNHLLKVDAIEDYCPNGLQVEGKENIKKIITGVSANQALFDAAAKINADAILVHHGLYWKKEDPRPICLMRNRLKILMQHDISLLAYHLPLDYHLKYGNNVQLAKVLNFHFKKTFYSPNVHCEIFIGDLIKSSSGKDLVKHISKKLNRQPFYLPGQSKRIEKIAWCTGGAQEGVYDAALQGMDAYITGEVSEKTVHMARELGIHFYAAEHHATELYGIQALGKHVAQKFKLQYRFINIENPV